MKAKKVLLESLAMVFNTRAEAKKYAAEMRAYGGALARVFPRTVRAGGAHIDVYAVVLYAAANAEPQS